jgi:prolyl oligopeptidase
VVEVLHGTEVHDPYRWLEEGESEETAAWVAAQNARTRAVLDAVPSRPALHERLVALLQVGMVGGPHVAADRVFTLQREGDQDQAVLVVRSAVDPGEPPRVVVDPHGLAADHAASIDWFSPSPDGRLVAYGVSEGGSEHGTLRIVEVDTGDHLSDEIPHIRHPSLAWLPDASAFAYSRLPDPATVPPGEHGYYEKVFWHRLGGDPAQDELLLGDGLEKTALPASTISPDGRWLVFHVSYMPTRTDVFLLDRETGVRTVVVEGEEATTWCEIAGDRLFANTNLHAPRGRVASAPLAAPQAEHWQTVVPEGSAVIEGTVIAGDRLIVASAEHAVSRLHHYALDGTDAREVALPELGSIGSLDADHRSARAFLTFTSFARPPGLWRWRAEEGANVEPWTQFPSPVDAADFAVEQVFYPSTDGTEVPMFLVRAATTTPSPETPTLLTAYGGFAISNTPGYSPGTVAFCEAGGVWAVAGIRGGGEYGEDWHRAGMLASKQQCFDDFHAAAAWLVATGRTGRERLAIRGGANGGLLVGAALTQRPDLCRAAVCAVPLLDMLRYHRFLIGALWVPEYGDPDDPAQFETLLAYSPYHRVVDGAAYPAALITTAESDSRVDPLHARKFAARLQAATSTPDERPVLVRIETRAGHGVGKPAWKQAEEAADVWAFVLWQLGVDGPPAG